MKIPFLTFFALLFIIPVYSQEGGGPYTADEHTVLLMHFNNDLSHSGIYAGSITNWGKAPVYETSMDGFGQAFRIDNENESGQCLLIEPTTELQLGNHWRIEFWVKTNSYGSGAAAFPSIFIKDGEGVSAIAIGLRSDGLGYNCRLTFSDQAEIWMEQDNGLDHSKWHHISLSSDSIDNQIYFSVRNENFQTEFVDSRPFPVGTDGELISANRQVFVGGVDGDSNIQFDGWIDELRISNTSRIYHPVPPEFLAESEFVEFYADENQTPQWDEIKDDIDQWYEELISYWVKPGRDLLFNEGEKVKIYLVDRNDLESYFNFTFPEWKYGAYKTPNEIYVSIPPAETESLYDGQLSTLVKNTLGQLILKKKQDRENAFAPSYFTEAFGLFYSGYKPDRDAVLLALDDLGRYPVLTDIQNIDDVATTYKKDLMSSYIEAQALSIVGIEGLNPAWHEEIWPNHLKHYYVNEDPNRIKLMGQTNNFDVYSTQEDGPYVNEILDHLENKLARYSAVYELSVLHKINVVVYPDRNTAEECIVIMDSYSFGSGWSVDKLDFISPRIDFSETTIFHELFHVFHGNFINAQTNVPSFHVEGLAEVMTYEGENDSYLQGRSWYFKDGLEKFYRDNGHYPNLAEVIESYEYMSVYSYGQAFWHWMKTNHTDYPTIKAFFENGLDWSVFNISYEEIDAGYINYLKQLAGIQTEVPGSSSNPTPVNGATAVSTNPTLSWTNGNNTDQSDLYFGIENPPTQKVLSDVTITTFQPATLTYSTTYFWRVVNKNTVGSTVGPVWSFTTDTGTGVENVLKDKNIRIYPNPVTNQLFFESNRAIRYIRIFNLTGALIYKKEDQISSHFTIDVQKWNQGIYLMQIELNEEIKYYKFIKE